MMESLQISYVCAVAAAAGCGIRSIEIDEGVDIVLTHISANHTAISDRVARLEIQMKATGGLFLPRMPRLCLRPLSEDRRRP